MKKSSYLFIFLVLLLLSPYLYVLREFTNVDFDLSSIATIYFYSSKQALASALLTLALSVPGALGLFWLRHKIHPAAAAIVEFFVLLPSLLPGLFIVVSFLNVIPVFPFGFWGVVILHAFAEVGLVSLLVHRIMEQRLSYYFDTAELMGCSPLYFLKKTIHLLVAPLNQVFFVLFLFFLSSVSIPLILAGGQYSTLESAIYQKILYFHEWNQALNLFIVQAVFMAVGFALLGRVKTDQAPVEVPSSGFLSKSSGMIVLLIPICVIVFSLVIKIPVGLVALSLQPDVLHGWVQYLVGSLLVGFLVGGCSFILLSVICYFYQFEYLRKFFSAIINPSFVILAFSFYLFAGTISTVLYVKISLALALGFLPSLLRFGFLQKLETLLEPVEVVAAMGASSRQIFWRGLWPQVIPQISVLSGLAGVWAMGDFAVSRIIAGRDMTLAMWVQSLVDQYRWDIALVLSWLLLAASLVVFGFFWSLSHVSYKKLN